MAYRQTRGNGERPKWGQGTMAGYLSLDLEGEGGIKERNEGHSGAVPRVEPQPRHWRSVELRNSLVEKCLQKLFIYMKLYGLSRVNSDTAVHLNVLLLNVKAQGWRWIAVESPGCPSRGLLGSLHTHRILTTVFNSGWG